MKIWNATIPIAGHVSLEVEAATKEEAQEKAFMTDLAKDGYVTWEALDSFGKGNVCHCPSPWSVEVGFLEEIEEDGENS